jgi:hypothetical protein
MHPQKPSRNARFEAFWFYYLRIHSEPLIRQLHYPHSRSASPHWQHISCSAIMASSLGGLVIAAAIAGASHAFVQHNRPAVSANALLALLCGFLMYFLWLAGRLEPELGEAGVERGAE